MINSEITKIVDAFDIDGKLVSVEANNAGNINKTYIVEFANNKKRKKYLIQRINSNVFTEPFKLMKNIEGVTTYLKRELIKLGDTTHQVLEVIKTKDGKSIHVLEDNGSRSYYRAYQFIENSISYDKSTDYEIVKNTGKAFGNFQRLLKDYPMQQLEETIKDFHDTEKRYEKFLSDIKIDPENRALEVSKEIVSILKRADIVSTIMKRLGKDIPLRVTHNDTKVNNVMMNRETGDYMAVIDLDTVMPGSMLFDYGDGIRSTASHASEDETNLDEVYLDFDLFKAYTDGYMSEMASCLSKSELDLMGQSIRIITLELAIRFLNDYINGDTYFRIDYPTHNLDRARNQLKLVMDIESKMNKIDTYIKESYIKYAKEAI